MCLLAVITLMATGKHFQINKKSFTCRASEYVAHPNVWLGFFFVSIVIMIADKDLSSCSVASRVSSRQIQNLSCKCPMHLYQAASFLALICANRFRPNHLLSFLLSNTRADESATSDLAWSSSRQSTELYNRQEFLASSSALIFK